MEVQITQVALKMLIWEMKKKTLKNSRGNRY